MIALAHAQDAADQHIPHGATAVMPASSGSTGAGAGVSTASVLPAYSGVTAASTSKPAGGTPRDGAVAKMTKNPSGLLLPHHISSSSSSSVTIPAAAAAGGTVTSGTAVKDAASSGVPTTPVVMDFASMTGAAALSSSSSTKPTQLVRTGEKAHQPMLVII